MNLATVIIVLVATPFVVYYSVKFGVYAWLRSRQLFDETQKGDRRDYGQEEK